GGFLAEVYAQRKINRRLSKQKVLKIISVNKYFSSKEFMSSGIMIKKNGKHRIFQNFFFVNVTLKNTTNKAFDKFIIQLDLPDSFKIMDYDSNSDSRSRNLKILNEDSRNEGV
ncbi:MAG: hypothetical protein AAFO82_21120, partial [Bacteroidota bacterium]